MMKNVVLPDAVRRSLAFYLAMEEYVASAVEDEAFFVWRVEPTVIYGRNQVLENEVNLQYCREHGVDIVRRKSGGGCVYSDLGNIMVSYISRRGDVSEVFDRYMTSLCDALRALGVPAEKSGRNDILVEGRKISGNAFHQLPDRSIVHGTLLYSTDLEALVEAIKPPVEKLQRHGVESVRQRVMNLSEYVSTMQDPSDALKSPEALEEYLVWYFTDGEIRLGTEDLNVIARSAATWQSEKLITKYMEENLLKTCLYDKHVALGALMSPFGGFIMPIQYTNITDEHNAVRHAAGMFDVSHMGEIFVSGPDADKFVNHVFSNDITGMEDGKILYGMMLYPSGTTVDDLLVYKEFEPNSYLLVVNASNIAKDYEWLCAQAEGYDVKVDNQSDIWGQIALQGPEAEKYAVETLGLTKVAELSFYTYYREPQMVVSRTGYTGEDGFEIYAPHAVINEMWDKLLSAGVVPCGLGCRDTLRFEAGLPLYGHELSEEITPLEAGLGMFAKIKTKDEFVGRDALVAQKEAGLTRKSVGIELQDKAIPRAGYPVEVDGVQVGIVTTGYRSISTDRSVCVALVDKAYTELGTQVEIRIRKKVFPGIVTKRRFYETNYKK